MIISQLTKWMPIVVDNDMIIQRIEYVIDIWYKQMFPGYVLQKI